jgi:hypothetical protein
MVDMQRVKKEYHEEVQRQACEIIKRQQTQKVVSNRRPLSEGIKITLADRVKAEQERVKRQAENRIMIEEERKSNY